MTIQVLGSGCPTCKKLHEITKLAVQELHDPTIEVEYITGVDGTRKIIELGAMSSPVICIDGKIGMVGFTPDINKIKRIISENMGK